MERGKAERINSLIASSIIPRNQEIFKVEIQVLEVKHI